MLQFSYPENQPLTHVKAFKAINERKKLQPAFVLFKTTQVKMKFKDSCFLKNPMLSKLSLMQVADEDATRTCQNKISATCPPIKNKV